MKKTIVISLVLFLWGCNSNHKVSTDISEMNLVGEVEAVKELSYYANNFSYKGVGKFSNVTKGRMKKDHDDFYVTFNAEGYIVEKKEYIKLSFERTKYTKEVYKYDDEGNNIEATHYNSNGDQDRRDVFEYDDEGYKIERSVFKPDEGLVEKAIYNYDDQGNNIEIVFYKPDGSLNSKTILKYDEKGNLIKSDSYNSSGGVFLIIYSYYDHRGNKRAKMTTNNLVGIIESEYEHDDKRNRIETREYDHPYEGKRHLERRLIDTINYQYVFDKRGNWIQRIEIKKNAPKYIIEREIKYYD